MLKGYLSQSSWLAARQDWLGQITRVQRLLLLLHDSLVVDVYSGLVRKELLTGRLASLRLLVSRVLKLVRIFVRLRGTHLSRELAERALT